MTSDLDSAVSGLIETISEISDEDLIVVARIIERAYIHVLVEQGLRVKVDHMGVSQLA